MRKLGFIGKGKSSLACIIECQATLVFGAGKWGV